MYIFVTLNRITCLKTKKEMEKRLVRKNKMFLGVCGGIADYMNVDPTLIRIIAVALIFFGIGSPILVYLIMAIVMPNEANLIP